MTEHYKDCWESEAHPACRLARIRILEAEVRKLKAERVETIHLPRPTWAAPCDDPPVATPGDQ